MSKRERYITIGVFLFPAVALYGVFFIWPMLQAFYVSLFHWSGMTSDMQYVGLENFRRLFTKDPVFWMSLQHNLVFLIASVVTVIPLGLLFASALARKVRGSGTYRAVFLFPNMISMVAVGVLWRFIYHPTLGILTSGLNSIGIASPANGWLGDSGTALPAVIGTGVWLSLGFYIILFLAGIRSIPPSYYEAAALDGASSWQSFRHITIPLLWEVLKLGLVYIVINSLNLFALVWVMTEGGPDNHTEVMLTYLYRLAFRQSDFGYATAVGVVAFAVVFSFSLVMTRLMRREVVEY